MLYAHLVESHTLSKVRVGMHANTIPLGVVVHDRKVAFAGHLGYKHQVSKAQVRQQSRRARRYIEMVALDQVIDLGNVPAAHPILAQCCRQLFTVKATEWATMVLSSPWHTHAAQRQSGGQRRSTHTSPSKE